MKKHRYLLRADKAGHYHVHIYDLKKDISDSFSRYFAPVKGIYEGVGKAMTFDMPPWQPPHKKDDDEQDRRRA